MFRLYPKSRSIVCNLDVNKVVLNCINLFLLYNIFVKSKPKMNARNRFLHMINLWLKVHKPSHTVHSIIPKGP